MILTQQDIAEFCQAYDELIASDLESDLDVDAQDAFMEWLTDNPQVLMAAGLQEYVGAHSLDLYRELVAGGDLEGVSRPAFRAFEGQWIVPTMIPYFHHDYWEFYSLGELKTDDDYDESPEEIDWEKRRPIRAWHDAYGKFMLDAVFVEIFGLDEQVVLRAADGTLEVVRIDELVREDRDYVYEQQSMAAEVAGDLRNELLFREEERRDPDRGIVELWSTDEIVTRAKKIVTSGLLDPVYYVSPKLWTPFAQNEEKRFLQESVTGIIGELQTGQIDLRSVKWQTLEEIVAEILRSRGMEISINRERPQGGRDVIARGELVPGMEAVTIAVEVKHKESVDRPEVELAIKQNEMFSALMFVTSGRFSGGVIREAKRPENRMRLYLKDGVALRELIRAYKLS